MLAYFINKYNNLNEGKAIAIKIKAGVIVQINSNTVPCVKYLWAKKKGVWLIKIVV